MSASSAGVHSLATLAECLEFVLAVHRVPAEPPRARVAALLAQPNSAVRCALRVPLAARTAAHGGGEWP